MSRAKTGTKRAAIYARISDARDDDVAGVTRQAEDCTALCEDKGWTVVDVFTDNNVSATRRPIGKRPAGARLLEAVEAGEIDVVVTWSADRLYRRPADLETLVDALGHVPVVTVKSGNVDLSTADGRMVARMLGSVAAHEVEKRGERVARAAAQRAQEGRYGGGRRRMGYNDTATELVLEEAEQIAWAYAHVANGGSLNAVSKRWREVLGTGPLGGQITAVQVRDVLLRPMNAGIAVYKTDGAGVPVEVGRTSMPTIIDEDTFRTVRAILQDPSRRTTVGRPAKAMLTPVIRCGKCGGRANAKNRTRHLRKDPEVRTKDPIYQCREGHVTKSRPHLDDAVGRLIVRWLQENADGLTKPRLPAAVKAANGAVADAEKHRKRLEDLAVLLANGDLEPADYAAATREVRARLAAVEERIVTATGHPEAAALIRAGDIEKAWQDATDDARRAVVKEVIDRIVLSPGGFGPFTMNGVEIEWKD